MDSNLEREHLTDEQLAAEAAREGSDGPAFVALCARYQERLWRVCYRLVGNAADARDAAQEVLVTMFMQRTNFQGRSRYSTWVHGIAIRTCLMARRSSGRRRHRETQAFEQRQQSAASQSEDHADDALDLAQILNTLDEEDRALLIMKYAEGHSYVELAAMFDKTASACKMRISRARQELRQRFPDYHFGDEED